MEAIVILVAAGRGERMGVGRPKAFLELAGVPLLLRAARAFETAASVQGLVAVVPADQVDMARALLSSLSKLSAVVAGGERRQDSVREGLKQLPADFDGVVLVHDAARPFVGPALVEAVCRAVESFGAAVPVVPLVDTIKRIREGSVGETVDRTALVAAQTPQGFRCSLLRSAYEAAYRDDLTVTDEAMAVERLGGPIVAVPGTPRNRKITTPEDLAWAEAVVACEVAS